MAMIIGGYDTNVLSNQSALKKLTLTSGGTKDMLDITVRDTSGNALGTAANPLVVDTELTLDGVNIDNVKVYSTDGTVANSAYGLVDGAGHVQTDVISSALPSGAATEATLSTLSTTATSIKDTDGIKKITDTVTVQQVANTISTVNSTTTPLSAGATFTGTSEDTIAYKQIHLTLHFSPNEVPDGDANTAQASLYVEFSDDETNWDISIPLLIRNSLFIPQAYIIVKRYYRIRYLNDGGVAAIASLGLTETAGTPTNQTAFRLSSMFLVTGTKELGRTLDQGVFGSDPVSLVRSALMGKTPDNAFVNIPVTGKDAGNTTKTPLTNSDVGTFTVDAGTDVVTLNGHGLSDTDRLVLKSSTTLPAGLAEDTLYYVRDSDPNTFKLAASSGGAAIDITDTGTGTHTAKTPGTYTGTFQDARGYSSVLPFVFGDQKLSEVKVQWSPDGSIDTTGLLGASTLTGTTISGFEVYLAVNTTLLDNYVRFEIVNGSDDHTTMETAIWFYDKPFGGSYAGLDSTLSTLSTALLTRSVIAGTKPSGTFQNVALTDSGALQQGEYGIEVSRGNLSDKTSVRKEGRSSNVTTTERVIWGSGTTYAFPTSASTVRVKVGGDAADDTAGNGAREVTVEGLDANGAEVTETIATAGASASGATTATFQRINRFYVSQAGTYATGAIATGSNTGVIQLETSGGVLLAVIAANLGRAASATYTIPASKKGYFRRIRVTPEGNKAITIRLWSRTNFDDNSAPMAPKLLRAEWSAINDESGFKLDLPFELAAKTDLWVTAYVAAGTQSASVAMEIEVVNDI